MLFESLKKISIRPILCFFHRTFISTLILITVEMNAEKNFENLKKTAIHLVRLVTYRDTCYMQFQAFVHSTIHIYERSQKSLLLFYI